MNVFAKFDEIPTKTLQDIKEKKRSRTHFRSFGQMDVKTVYPPTNTVCWGYKNKTSSEEEISCIFHDI